LSLRANGLRDGAEFSWHGAVLDIKENFGVVQTHFLMCRIGTFVHFGAAGFGERGVGVPGFGVAVEWPTTPLPSRMVSS
jgi:hypothetical protein